MTPELDKGMKAVKAELDKLNAMVGTVSHQVFLEQTLVFAAAMTAFIRMLVNNRGNIDPGWVRMQHIKCLDLATDLWDILEDAGIAHDFQGFMNMCGLSPQDLVWARSS